MLYGILEQAVCVKLSICTGQVDHGVLIFSYLPVNVHVFTLFPVHENLLLTFNIMLLALFRGLQKFRRLVLASAWFIIDKGVSITHLTLRSLTC